MPLTAQQISDLQAIARRGEKVHVCEYIKVEWQTGNPTEDRYYAAAPYNTMPPFVNIGVDIEPRLVGEPFKTLELFPDLRTETFPLVFDDIDKTMRARFQGFGGGANIEVFLYYPQVSGHYSLWFGQLQAPSSYGAKTIPTVATNGFRSREQQLPKRQRSRECSHRATAFGGQLTVEALKTHGCKYDKQHGGSIGNFRTGSTPYIDCPGDEAACAARGMTAYFGGYKAETSAVVTDQGTGYLAVSKGNATSLRQPIPVIFGTKYKRSNQLIFWRREINANDPDKGWVAGVWEVGEGPLQSISNIKVQDRLLQQMHQAIRLGHPAQTNLSQYAPDLGNYSNVAHYMGRDGWTDAAARDAGSMTSECLVQGYSQVTVLNQTAAGNGLKGAYYATTSFTNLVSERVDATINFPTRTWNPIQGINYQSGFSVRWTGTITFDTTEQHTFTLTHDDGVVLTVNAVEVINNSGIGTHTGLFTPPAADTPYTIQLDFVQNTSALYNPWGVVLEWQSASLPKEIVPSSALAHSGVSGSVKMFTNNRVWCLLESMHNTRFGMGYPLARFNTANWLNGASWSGQNVTFSYTNEDGETRNFAHQRTRLDVIMEGRPVAEQLVDICRAGRFSIPFQKDGEFYIQPFRAFTTAEIAAAPIFTDTGSGQNIIWRNGVPAIDVKPTPDNKLTNEITLSFEDGAFQDQERPVTVDNPNQKLKAGRQLGTDSLFSVPKQYSAFGIRNLNEVVKLGYGFLRFGEFDEGGILNNLPVTIEVPFVETLGLERYQPIKIRSTLLDGFLLPIDDVFSGFEQAETFRVLKIIKTSNDTAKITAIAYNHTAYSAFETNSSVYPPILPPPNPEPDDDSPFEPPAKVLLNAIDYNDTTKIMLFTTALEA